MFPKQPWLYRRLNQDDSDDRSQPDKGTGIIKAQKDSNARRFILEIICSLLVLFTTFLAGIVLGFYLHKLPLPRHFQHNTYQPPTQLCGNSSKEALSLGCTFDQLTWAWYPPHCPHYANDEFVNAEPDDPWRYRDNLYHGNFVYATDENFPELLDSGVQLWAEKREHLSHCVYMFLSVGQIVRDGGRHVPRLAEYHHLVHCSKMILDELRQSSGWHDITTAVPRPHFDQTC